jgi:thymidylate kinase
VTVIELFGAPGAGKSAVLPELADALRRRGWRARLAEEAIDARLARTPLGRLIARLPYGSKRIGRLRTPLVDLPHGVAFTLRHRRLVATVLLAVLRAPVSWGHRLVLLHRFFSVAAREQFLRGRLADDEVAIFDEGLIHRTVNLYAWRRRPPSREVDDYLRRIPLPDLAVHVEVPAETAAARMASRGLPLRLRGHDQAMVTRFLANAADVVSMARRSIDGSLPVVHVTNEGDLVAVREDLSAAMDGALGTAPRARRRAQRPLKV